MEKQNQSTYQWMERQNQSLTGGWKGKTKHLTDIWKSKIKRKPLPMDGKVYISEEVNKKSHHSF